MADLIVGYPTNMTTVSAGAGGNIRVTFAPWELDWEYFLAIAVDGTNSLANVTTTQAVPIVAKGGAENLGYWFEINLAFPSANWNTGDRIAPQRQLVTSWFTNFAAAIAGMAFNDVWLIWYMNTANRRFWGTYIDFNNIAGSVWGMLSRRQVVIGSYFSGNGIITYRGNILNQNVQAFVVNLQVLLSGGVGYSIIYSPGVGQVGAGLAVRRNRIFGGQYGVYFLRANGGTCAVINNIFSGSYWYAIIGISNGMGPMYFNSCFSGTGPIASANNLFRNNILGEGFYYSSGTAITYCADTYATIPIAAGNLRGQNARTQFRMFFDVASPGRKKFGNDPRIYRDSVLAGAGIAVAGITTDIDGRPRPNPPSMGAFEPYNLCYAPGSKILRGTTPLGVGG